MQFFDGSLQGDLLGGHHLEGHHFAMAILDFMTKFSDFLSPTDTGL